jgi:hypothetical protein
MKTFEVTLEQLRAIFIAGGEFEKQTIEFDTDERDSIDAPDFGELLDQINIT